MKNISILLSSIFLFLITGIKAQVPQSFTTAKIPEEVGFSSERLKRLDTHFQEVIDKGIAPNIVTLVAKKGKLYTTKPLDTVILNLKRHSKKMIFSELLLNQNSSPPSDF